jgi:hypothetical protein
MFSLAVFIRKVESSRYVGNHCGFCSVKLKNNSDADPDQGFPFDPDPDPTVHFVTYPIPTV